MSKIKSFWVDVCDFLKFKMNGGSNTLDFMKKRKHIKAVMDESYNKWKTQAEMNKARTMNDFPSSIERRVKEVSKTNV